MIILPRRTLRASARTLHARWDDDTFRIENGREPGRAARTGALPPLRRRRRALPDPTEPRERRMPTDATEDTRTYIVLVNHEEQYSLWLADKEIPLGWSAVGKPGSREECLAYVKEVWTDMTPKSLRKQPQQA